MFAPLKKSPASASFLLCLVLASLCLSQSFTTASQVSVQSRKAILRIRSGDESPTVIALEEHPDEQVQTEELVETTSDKTNPPPPPPQQPAQEEPSEEQVFLKDALLRNVLFADLPEESLQALIDSFERVEYKQNDVIIRQGDTCEGDYVYVVYEGQCSVEVDGQQIPRPYGRVNPKALFGELAVMYNRTRAATVSCWTPSITLFRIPCEDYKNILNQKLPADYTKLSELEEIDTAIKEIEGTKSLYGGAIIRPYNPSRLWLWSRFTGTVLQHVARPTLLSMLWSVCFITFARHRTFTPGSAPWAGLGLPPDASHPFIAKLQMVHTIWGYLQGLTTFILTFFLNQAFSFWREIYDFGRGIQGRLNDFHLILATTASRKRDGSYTPKSESLLEDVGQYSRLFHALFWAAYARRFRVLQTRAGLERMASRGLMTSKQLECLLQLDLPEDQRHSACIEWMMVRTDQGIEDGTLISDAAHRQMLIAYICNLRGTFASIGDKLDGRMPLAYTHFVQVLVDAFVWTAPIALYAELGAWSVICVGVLTLFYTGLLDLAKIFLDPLNNEDFYGNSIFMDIGVLIRESNAGSTRWKRGAAALPF